MESCNQEINSTLHHAIDAYLNAPSWKNARDVVLQFPCLLKEVAEQRLRDLLTEYEASSREHHLIKISAELLVQARKVGVEQAFASKVPNKRFGEILEALRKPADLENRETRIALSQEGLSLCDGSQEPRQQAILFIHLGNAYAMNQSKMRGESEKKAVKAFCEAERIFGQIGDRQGVAHARKNMGHIHASSWKGDLSGNQRLAVDCYEEALRYFQPLDHSEAWTSCMNGLVSVYVNWLGPNPDEHLAISLRLLNEILSSGALAEGSWEWAKTQHNLALVLEQMETEDRRKNLEKAIEACNAALTVRCRGSHPFAWARTTGLLADVYQERIEGDANANLQAAKYLFKCALEVLSPEDSPHDWARIALDFGRCLFKSEPYRREDSEEAIKLFHELTHFYRESPTMLAEAKHFLAEAYLRRRDGDPTKNLSMAIDLLEESLATRKLTDSPLTRIDTLVILAEAYLRREAQGDLKRVLSSLNTVMESLKAGERPFLEAKINAFLCQAYTELNEGSKRENVEKALSYGNLAHTFFTEAKSFKEKAIVASDLAKAYLACEAGDKTVNRSRALQLIEESLQFFAVEKFPSQRAKVMSILGSFYFHHCEDAREEALEQAIACYQTSLGIFSREDHQIEVGRTWMNLGVAFSERIQGSKRENQEQAIKCFHRCSSLVDRKGFSAIWGDNLNNLGTVLLARLEGDRGDNIVKAMWAFRQSLQVKSQTKTPLAWAESVDNLASAYLEDVRGDRWQNVEKAIGLYSRASEVFQLCKAEEKWGDCQFRLGNAWRLNRSNSKHLENAIVCFQASAKSRPRNHFPYKWAQTKLHLGLVYVDLGPGYLNKAMECFQEGLATCHRKVNEILWAELENNLADARLKAVLEEGAQPSEAIEKGYQQALSVFTRERNPYFYRWIYQNLGLFYFVTDAWERAIEALSESEKATEDIRSSSSTLDSRLASVRFTESLNDFLAVAMAQSGKLQDTIVAVERRKSRELNWRLKFHPSSWRHGSEAEKAQGETLVNQTLTVELRLLREQHLELYSELILQRQTLQTKLNELMESFNQDPEYEEITPLKLATLAGTSGSIPVYLCLTSLGGTAFWLNEQGVVSEIHLPNLRMHKLLNFVNGVENNPGPGALESPRNRHQLEGRVQTLCDDLSESLVKPLLSNLPEKTYRLTVFPSGPLHHAPLQMAFPDEVYVNQIASGKLWQETCSHRTESSLDSLLVVSRPLPSGKDLPFAGESLFSIANLLPEGKYTCISGFDATRDQLEALAKRHRVLHFAGHAIFNAGNPMNSGLLLAQDQMLRLDEIWHGDLDLTHVGLVVLAACRTGHTERDRDSEEALGLPQALLMAGASSVITSLWDVADLSSELLFQRFYYELFEMRVSVVEALGKAQRHIKQASYETLDLIANLDAISLKNPDPSVLRLLHYHRRQARLNPTKRPFSHPYHWAGFIYSGF